MLRDELAYSSSFLWMFTKLLIGGFFKASRSVVLLGLNASSLLLPGDLKSNLF